MATAGPCCRSCTRTSSDTGTAGIRRLSRKLNTPDNFYQHAVLAMCYAQLGEMDAARKAGLEIAGAEAPP